MVTITPLSITRGGFVIFCLLPQYVSILVRCSTFPALIASWRKHWHVASGGATDATFPFGFVQLSTWGDKNNNTCGDRLTRQESASCDVGVVRWGQTANVGSVPNDRMPETFMAVAVDMGDSLSPFGDIHPRHKREVPNDFDTWLRLVLTHSASVF